MKIPSLRSLALFFAFGALAFLTLAVASADNNLDATKYDGRLNQAVWLGNHAVYCIDHNGLPTSDGWTDGGIRVLDGNGQVVFFAPAAEIEALGVPTENTLIHAEGSLSLYRQPDGGFSLNGLDEYSSPYTFVFNDCVPIGPTAYTHTSIPQPEPTEKVDPPCSIQSPQGVAGPQGC